MESMEVPLIRGDYGMYGILSHLLIIESRFSPDVNVLCVGFEFRALKIEGCAGSASCGQVFAIFATSTGV